MAATTVHYKDLESLVGKDLGTSDWLEITQQRVNQFAEATGDFQWIHVDVERATELLGSPIAHGFLTLSLLPMLGPQILSVEGVTRGINYGSNKVRFTSMVPVGSKVRMSQSLKDVSEKAGGKQMTANVTIEIEGHDRPALVAETITLLFDS